MDATSSRDDSASAWCAAVDLASHVAAGGHLPSVASRVLLEPGEVLHADVTAQGWRFAGADVTYAEPRAVRSEEHTSELQSLMRISYAVFCLKKKKKQNKH